MIGWYYVLNNLWTVYEVLQILLKQKLSTLSLDRLADFKGDSTIPSKF